MQESPDTELPILNPKGEIYTTLDEMREEIFGILGMKGNHKIQNGIDEPRYLLGVVRHLSPMRLNGEDANRITYEGFTDEVLKIVQVELLPCIETYTGNDLRNILGYILEAIIYRIDHKLLIIGFLQYLNRIYTMRKTQNNLSHEDDELFQESIEFLKMMETTGFSERELPF